MYRLSARNPFALDLGYSRASDAPRARFPDRDIFRSLRSTLPPAWYECCSLLSGSHRKSFPSAAAYCLVDRMAPTSLRR